MAPKATNGTQLQSNPHHKIDDEIVISGMSGRFPECDTVEEFKEKLFANEDLVKESHRRWPPGLYGVPERLGTVKDLSHFDAEYFEVNAKQADKFDPQLRVLLEVTHEALVDAGINPKDIRGSKTGVIVGCSASESREYFNADLDTTEGYALIGCFRSNFSNLISQLFDFNGLSFTLDTACSSVMYALHVAVEAIKSGQCEAFIVAGANLCLKPSVSLQFTRLRMTTLDGKCKAFDASGDGYVRAETISAVYIQKAKDAKRVYATILGTKANTDGYKEQGIGFPSGRMQLKLMRELYAEEKVNPAEIQYVEAHGTGTSVGDPQEVNALTDIMCPKDRKNPLYIGSVKSNMGHAEAGAGLCSITKVCLAMEESIIPANLHFKNPNPDIYGILDGRVKVVTKNLPWEPKMAGISSFGFGGANAHCILKANQKTKEPHQPEIFPYICGVSGRTEAAVSKLINKIKQHQDDPELFGLIHNIHRTSNNGHDYRGYVAFTNPPTEEITNLTEKNRPIWFAYTGLGAQWTGMAKDLLKIDICKNAIDRCAKVLKEKFDFDLYNILLTTNENELNELQNALAGTAAVQIALTNLLKSVNIIPDGVLGHSAGEVMAAYADGALELEQAIQCSFVRAKAVQDAYKANQVSSGAMAAVGLTWEEAKELCPEGVFPACHNSVDNCTISGYKDKIESFVSELQSKGRFAKAVNSCNLSFHCPVIKAAETRLRKLLSTIIIKPIARSSKWVSTSVTEDKWDNEAAKYCSADYQVNNMFGPVLFYEALQHIPSNAIVIEVSPSGLLSGIIKRSLTPTNTILSLLKRKHENNIDYMVQQLGKLYNNGGQPHFEKLYAPVSFPVSRGTPRLGSDIEWDHSLEWSAANFTPAISNTGHKNVTVDLKDNQFLKDHIVDGRDIYPLTGLLYLVWKTLAGFKNINLESAPVEFQSIEITRPVLLPKSGSVKLHVSIYGENGEFVLSEDGSDVCKGAIRILDNSPVIPENVVENQSEEFVLEHEDIYKIFVSCGYEYRKAFRGLKCSNDVGTVGKVTWENNWVTFLDAIIQFALIDNPKQTLRVPVSIKHLVIDPQEHLSLTSQSANYDGIRIELNRNLNVLKCGGIMIKGLGLSKINRQINKYIPTIQKYLFVPDISENQGDVFKDENDVITVMLRTVIRNSPAKFEILELVTQDTPSILQVKNIVEKIPTVATIAFNTLIKNEDVDINDLKAKDIKVFKKESEVSVSPTLVLLSSVDNESILTEAKQLVDTRGFILIENNNQNKLNKEVLKKLELVVVSEIKVFSKIFTLLRTVSHGYKNAKVIEVNEDNFSWIKEVQQALDTKSEQLVYLVSRQKDSGLTGLMNVLKVESGTKNLRSIDVPGKIGKFDLNEYSDQLQKDLVYNVFKNNVWGSYHHVSLENFDYNKQFKMVESAFVNTLYPDTMSSLSWIEGPLPAQYDKTDEYCQVAYSSLNFRDLMIATGKLSTNALPGKVTEEECLIGLEYSGCSENKKRVMGIKSNGGLSTIVKQNGLVWEVPSDWSLEEAASVPLVYTTAYYALIVKGRMQPRESVLIHCGASGVGHAAIKIALHMGCTVYTTAGTDEKRTYLAAVFPQIPSKNISDSRSADFEELILNSTNGRGVDLVLNCLSGELLEASVNCLANHGRFLEIGKADLSKNTKLGMAIFLKSIAFHGILCETLFEKDNKERKIVYDMVLQGIADGVVTPLPTIVFEHSEVLEAFRFMSTGTHIGKIVIKIQDENVIKPEKISAISRVYMNPNKTYILVGGLGGIGLEFIKWLVSRGAKNIIITSRSGIKTGYQHIMIKWLRQQGAQVLVEKVDTTKVNEVENLLQKIRKLGPIGGIFNLAMTLKNSTFEFQTEENFKETVSSKLETNRVLDLVSRKVVPDLDYFVFFSTIVGCFGNAGQSPYAMGSIAGEKIIEARKEANLSGLAIQWGPVSDTGYITEHNLDTDLKIAATSAIPLSSYFHSLDIVLQNEHAVQTFYHIKSENTSNASDDTTVSLVECVGQILGLRNKNYDSISKTATLVEFGLDSFMTQEVQQLLEFNFNIEYQLAEVRNLTFQDLINIDNEHKAKN